MRIGELFAGYGGLGMGVQAAIGGEVVWVSEIDKGACKVLAHRFPDVPNIGDITAINWAAVEPVDVLTGGFPCTNISSSGAKAGIDGEQSRLWRYFADAIRELRPSIVVVENVGDLVHRGLGRVLGDLAALGMDAEWTSVSACRIGAPFARLRLFILATPAGADTSGLARKPEQHRTPIAPPPQREQWQQRHADRLAVEDQRALDRWAQLLGRAAPDPLERGINNQPRLTAAFHEWLLGLPDGWVTDVPGVTRSEALRLCGNGVVPQQAAAALRWLLSARAAA